ncbi:hypothetical protein HT031_003095 [Scenedesmus sp. PABB004]|nr:hypothetical protein HT031_003095 [Scenedesmus sp. PABB004]
MPCRSASTRSVAIPVLLALAVVGQRAAGDRAQPALGAAASAGLAGAALPAASYDARSVDWMALADACLEIGARAGGGGAACAPPPRGARRQGTAGPRCAGKYERRMAGFIIRAGYHDAMSIDTDCLAGQPADPVACGGADASALLSSEEQGRDESRHRSYLKRAAAAIVPLAARYNASAANTLAVCAMALPAAVGAPNMLRLAPLRVGRADRAAANPAGHLLPGEADLVQLDAYWRARGLTLDEGVALLGAHALMEGKGCTRARRGGGASGRRLHNTCGRAASRAGRGRAGTTRAPACNPYGLGVDDPVGKPFVPGSCSAPSLAMHRLDSQFYVDLITPAVAMTDVETETSLKARSLGARPRRACAQDLDAASWRVNLADITCSFTSDQFRRVGIKEAEDERSGSLDHWPDAGWLVHNTTGVSWSREGCAGAARGKARANCQHMEYWPYTRLDGFMAMACTVRVRSQRPPLRRLIAQRAGRSPRAGGLTRTPPPPWPQNPGGLSPANRKLARKVAAPVKKYVGSEPGWYADYAAAYAKMMSAVADWSSRAFYPTFTECATYVEAGTGSAGPCARCKRPPAETDAAKAAERLRRPLGAGGGAGCPASCVCSTAYRPGDIDFKTMSCANVCVD